MEGVRCGMKCVGKSEYAYMIVTRINIQLMKHELVSGPTWVGSK